MIPTLEVAGGWETVLEGPAREALGRSVLPDYLRAQRWFGGKGRQVESVRLSDWGDVPAGSAQVYLTLLEVRFADGNSDHYFLPLAVTGGPAAARMLPSRQAWVIAWLRGPQGEALLHDALADDDTCSALLAAIGSRREFATRRARVVALPTAAFAELRGDPGQPLPIERGPATSSNSLLFYGRRLMMKLFRRLEPGINPDFEIGRFLTESHRFDRIPRVAGSIEYRRPDAPPTTLAILQANVINQGDGWHHALDELGRYFARVAGRDPLAPDDRPLVDRAASAPPPSAADAIGDYLHAAGTLGRRTAELHRALAAGAEDPAFAPVPFTPADASALRTSIHTQGRQALDTLRDNLDKLPQEVAISARRLLDEGPRTLEQLEKQTPPHTDAAKIRCHGDYHLGQVLRVDEDYFLLDFEGEPTRTIEERRARQSPLKDVAGMVRSYHYAAYAGLFAFTRGEAKRFARMMPWADLWFVWSSAAFLRDYRTAADEASFLPREPAAFAALLDSFLLDKAFYELNYELNNRPDWVRIPLRGILALVERMTP